MSMTEPVEHTHPAAPHSPYGPPHDVTHTHGLDPDAMRYGSTIDNHAHAWRDASLSGQVRWPKPQPTPKEIEEFVAVLRGSSLGSPRAIQNARIGVACEEVDLINSIVFAQLSGDAEALIRFVGELAEKWPR